MDGVVGALSLTDRVRPEAAAMLHSLRRLGIRRIVLASGDTAAVAQSVAGDLGVDDVRGDLAPEEKVALVLAERHHGPVLMVGDGVNDAPALAAADVGIALGVRGAAASSEVADAVLLVDRIDPLAAGIAGAQRARQVALQSVVAGIGLSFLAMGLPPSGTCRQSRVRSFRRRSTSPSSPTHCVPWPTAPCFGCRPIASGEAPAPAAPYRWAWAPPAMSGRGDDVDAHRE